MRRPMRPNEISSGGVVVRRAPDGYEVCLVSDGRHWGFPKGLIEPGETPERAAVREISEETGIPAASLVLRAPLPLSEYVYRRANHGALVFKRVHHFIVEAPEGTALHPDPAEIAAADWLGFDAAKARLSFRNSVEVLEAARTILEPRGAQGVPATEP
ncbi:MAG: NUDIX domain-containing protein [Candidatus Dormibacteria bacterium]|jgi:bis(5'-nucleosidyl)-tetraphosphatase